MGGYSVVTSIDSVSSPPGGSTDLFDDIAGRVPEWPVFGWRGPASASPSPMRTLEEIRAEILALEQETEGFLEEIVGAIEKQ